MDIKGKPIYCDGEECDTPSQAWESWRQEALVKLGGMDSVKVWRCLPELFKDTRYDEGRDVYIVKSRAIMFNHVSDLFSSDDVIKI